MRSLVPVVPVGLLFALASLACDSPTPNSPTSGTATETATVPTPDSTVSTSATATSVATAPTSPPVAPPPAPPIDVVTKLAKSSNAFGLDLYGDLHKNAGNLAFSPLSITTALTMTWDGAHGETAAQMKKVLHADDAAAATMDAAGKLAASMSNTGKQYTFEVANRLFGDKAYAFDKGFLDATAASFGAPMEPLDFAHGSDPARTHINDWVKTSTHDRITDLLPVGSLTSDTRLVLVDAIYFKGDWEDPFMPAATSDADFHTSKSDAKKVSTMHQTSGFSLTSGDGVKVLEMGYEGGTLAMDVILPDAVDGIADVEKKLSTTEMDGWFKSLKGERVSVSLPKFEINPEKSLALADELKKLGMTDAFDKDKADFTGIAKPASPDDRLYISKVFHKAFVKVDEKGTEAAAATAVEVARAGSAAPAKPEEFNANHPFLYVLRDRQSGMILFMGRVSDPSSK